MTAPRCGRMVRAWRDRECRHVQPDRGGQVATEYPDVYADAFSFGASPYGCTLTLMLSQPTPGATGPEQAPNIAVARVRFGHTLARDIAKAISDMLAQSGLAVQPSQTTKH